MQPRAEAPGRAAWIETSPGASLPPLDVEMRGWEVEKRRRSHWNARRQERGSTWHLKWFFHGPWRNPARREFRAAARVAALGIPTVLARGWGRHPLGTFVVLEGSPGFPANEWRRAELGLDAVLEHAVRLAEAVARLHDAGLCHRDLNVYHVLVDGPSLRLIDLGRVKAYLLPRWVVKDLASLLESALREGFPARCARQFLRRYLSATRRRWRRRTLLRRVVRKALRYRAHNDRREARTARGS